MSHLKPHKTAIQTRMRENPQALRRDFEALAQVHVDLPQGERAYWTLPRVKGQWRLSKDSNVPDKSNEMLLIPVRDDRYAFNAYMAVIPQPIIMHRKVAEVLEAYAYRLFQHYPEENSLARREYGIPMLLGRFDVIVDQQGNMQICELDDVCSLWPAMSAINPIVDSYLKAFEAQLELPIYTAELFQYSNGPAIASPLVRKEYCQIMFYDDDSDELRTAYVPRNNTFMMGILQENGIKWRESRKPSDKDVVYYQRVLRRFYAHNEDYWRGDIHEAWLLKRKKLQLDEIALSVRAYRDMPGFTEHMNRYGPRSIAMAWERDSKWSLVAENLAVLAANLEVAVAFGKQWQKDHPDQLLVFKTLYGARTEGTAIFSSKGTKGRGVSSAKQIERKFGKAVQDPIVIQPYKEPDSLNRANIRFIGTSEENGIHNWIYTDKKIFRSVDHVGSKNPGERIMAGMEDKFFMIFRSFIIYLPKEKRLVHAGGLWQATDGRIVHGGAHSVAGPLYIDGLMGHPGGEFSASLQNAEAMVREHELK